MQVIFQSPQYNKSAVWHNVTSILSQFAFRAVATLVQSLNSPFFPPHIGAEPGRAKEESRITCMRMLRTNQSKITRPLSIRVHTCSRTRVAQYLFQLALWKKKQKHLFGVDILVKKQIDMCFIVVCTLIDNDYESLLFSQTFFRIVSGCWASLHLKGKSDAYK